MSKFEFPAFIKLEAKGTDDAKGRFLAAVDQMANAGESRMGEFATNAQLDIDRALRVSGLTKNAFASDMDSTLAALQTKLSTFGNTARRNLEAALSGKLTPAGGVDLDVAGAREAAAVAERRAALARQLADATRNAALAEKDFSQATRLSIAAAKDLASTETQAAAAARVQADATEKLQAAMQRAGVTSQAFGAANDNLTRATGAQRQGLQQLGFQLNDVATMYALGAKPAQIFASQIGQITQAMQLLSGGTSRFAGFLMGPWGQAITLGTIVLSPFIGKLFETVGAADTARSALQKLIDKQREAAAGSLDDTQALVGLNAMRDKRLKLQIELDTANADPKGLNGGVLPKSTRVLTRQLRELQLQIVEAEGAIAATDAKRADIERRSTSTKVEATRAVTGHGTATKAATVAIRDQAQAVTELDKILEGMTRTLKDVQLATAGDITKPFDAMLEKLGGGQSDAVRGAVAASQATADWNSELADTVRLLDQIGGAGSALGDIGRVLGAISAGNLSALPGAAGIIGKALGGVTWQTIDPDGTRMVRQLGDEFSQVLDRVFGGNGTFAKVLESAGIGSAAGGIVNGQGNSAAGSAIGGILGEVAGKAIGKTIGGTLGKALGPLGSIAGGILGGALGGLFKSVQSGYAQVRNGQVVGTYGRTGDLQTGAASVAAGLVDQIGSIADALGTRLGAFEFDIGRKDSNFVVNTGAKGTFNFKTEAEAIAFAIRDAVYDGAFVGLSEGAKRLLQNGGDLQRQLQKAVSFQNVSKELRAIKDPVGAAIDGLNSEFRNLIDIFKEAGASTAEFANLEELYGLKRAEAIEDANDRALASLKGLQSFLTIGSEFYSLRDRQASALAVYNPLRDRVAAGDSTAFDAFSDAAQSLLQIDRAISGSTGTFFARADEIRALTDQAIAGQNATSATATISDSPFAALAAQQGATVSAIDNQTNALLGALGAINDNTVNVIRQLIANGNAASPGGTVSLAIGQRGYF